MAARHRRDRSTDGGYGRRTFLKMTGAVAAAATAGAVIPASTAAQSPEYDPSETVNLGEVGLSDGDQIDPYLSEYFRSGVEVRVPAGTYRWGGGGLGAARRNAGLIGERDGAVVLETSSGRYRDTIRAAGGELRIGNLTVHGAVRRSRIRVETDASGRILIGNWHFPDGSQTNDRSRAFYAPRAHAGEIEFRGCYVHGFSDNGIYASSPGFNDARGGRIVVDRCFAHNNNIAGIRVGSDNSVVRNCTVMNDARSPRAPTGRNQRGIWVRTGGDGVRIENCEVIHLYEGAGIPINFGRHGRNGSGTIEDVRVYNNTGAVAINAPRAWSGEDVHVEGDGNLRVPSGFDTCGNGCDHSFSQNHGRSDVLAWHR